MTKLQSANGEMTNGLVEENSCDSDEDVHDVESEPLGYQHFLYDVNIEYSPGGTRSSCTDNKHCFKMKYLPYMVLRNRLGFEAPTNITRSDDLDDDDTNNDIVDSECRFANNTSNDVFDPKLVNVTKTTCAFLGKSEFVPTNRYKHRRVILELISAKLSQQTTHGIPTNSSYTNLIDVAENPAQNGHISNRDNGNLTPISSSKKFVNYTLLIKTAPGLDNHPAVIERRFSDFLTLYQGLKSDMQYANIVDRYVTFPKKVYMGNFSVAKIAERSIEFTRLLSICMSRINLLWSLPFVSFLIDKELKEAHRLSLFGDPDDVQALVETVYHIEKKLYLPGLKAYCSRDDTTNSSSNSLISTSFNNNGQYSPTNTTRILPNGMNQSLSNETISADSNVSNQTSSFMGEADPSPDQSVSCEQTSQLVISQNEKANCSLINQRILATFCMLFIVYFRNNSHQEMRLAVREFNQLISSQDYIDSLINTRHYMSLRACLLFLMNLNQDNVISESTRLWLKRKLEDVDGVHAELEDRSINGTTRGETTTNINRVTQRDLTSLLKDRNFCDFQSKRA